MKVFVSWSKEPSKSVATALRSWLKDVIQNLDPWMSDQDIQGGERWSASIGDNLESHNLGILVLTHDNQFEPWINFEAGALSKALGSSRVIPYLFNFPLSDLSSPPLIQFQGRVANREGTFRLISDINSFSDRQLEEAQLRKAFDLNWPFLESELEKIVAQSDKTTKNQNSYRRTSEDKLDELVILMRGFDRTLSQNEYYGTKRRRSFTKPDPYSLQGYFYTIRKTLDELDIVKEYEIEHDAMCITIVVEDGRDEKVIIEELSNHLYPTTNGEYKIFVEDVKKYRKNSDPSEKNAE